MESKFISKVATLLNMTRVRYHGFYQTNLRASPNSTIWRALSRTNCTEIDIFPRAEGEAESLLHIPAQNRFVPAKLDIYNPINVQGRRVAPFET